VYDALNKMCSAAGDPLLVKEGLRELEELLQENATDGEWRDVHRDKFLMELARAVSPSQVRESADFRRNVTFMGNQSHSLLYIIALITPWSFPPRCTSHPQI
jgi:hypothetical protein